MNSKGILAAIFLMATSAIGPGFITQTANFTVKFGAAFAFAILLSILIDIIVQQNIWRMVSATGRFATELANTAIPFSGHLLAVLVIFGGLVFNVGNIAGTGLGLSSMAGIDPKIGGLFSAAFAIFVFSSKKASIAMDRLVIGLGLLMLALTLYVCFTTQPPVALALKQSVLPDAIDMASITTIIGGTVGGYICYSGAHNILDKGLVGKEHQKRVGQAATNAIIIVGAMRCILFLAMLGVITKGGVIDLSAKDANPAAQAFFFVLGDIGTRIFGFIFWAAAITSVFGCAYTCMSFLKPFWPSITLRQRNIATIFFICISLLVYVVLNKAPAALLVFAGGFNGLILPLGLSIFVYLGFKRQDLMDGYKYPAWLLYSGLVACLLTWYMGLSSIKSIFAYLN